MTEEVAVVPLDSLRMGLEEDVVILLAILSVDVSLTSNLAVLVMRAS